MSAQADALLGPRPTVSFNHVLARIADRIQDQYAEVIQQLPGTAPQDRPTALLQFTHNARQQLLRAAALLYDPRKLAFVQHLQEPAEGVLDVCATQARGLQAAADELFKASQELRLSRTPLFCVHTALDILGTGTYRGLPQHVMDHQGPRQLPPAQQKRLVGQLNHLLYQHLVKASLPPSLEVVRVAGGSAVLRCPGLYEVKLSLQQRPYAPAVLEARRKAATCTAAAATGAAAAAAATASAPAAAGGGEQPPAAASQPQPLQDGGSGSGGSSQGADTGGGPEVRWQWVLLDVVLLPNAAVRPALRPQQLGQLVAVLRLRMALTADAAALAAAEGKGSNDAGAAVGAAGAVAAAAVGTSAPAASEARSGATTATGLSSLTGASGRQAGLGRDVQLKRFAADEIAAPLRMLHGVLRDVSAQLLLEDVRVGAEALAAPGSRWAGQLRVEPPQLLRPGVRLVYWTQAPLVLLEPAGQGSTTAAAGAGGAAADGGGQEGAAPRQQPEQQQQQQQPAAGRQGVQRPALEVGIGDNGLLQVVHVPPLEGITGPGASGALVLDTHRVDVAGLLLQASAHLALQQLQVVLQGLMGRIQEMGLAGAASARLVVPAAPNPAAAAATGTGADGEGASKGASKQQLQQQQAQSPDDGLVAAAGAGLTAATSSPLQQQAAAAAPAYVEVWVEGTSQLRVLFEGWSGRLLLRPGAYQGGLAMLPTLAHGLVEEEKLQELASSSMARLMSQQGRPAQEAARRVLLDTGRQLGEAAAATYMEVHTAALLAAAHRLSLHHTHPYAWLGPMPRVTPVLPGAPSTPGSPVAPPAASPTRRYIYLSFPTTPLPPYLRGLLLQLGPGPGARVVQQRDVGSLGAVLVVQVPALDPRRYWLRLTACSSQGVPSPAYKEVPVPAAVVQAAHQQQQQQPPASSQPPPAAAGAPGSNSAAAAAPSSSYGHLVARAAGAGAAAQDLAAEAHVVELAAVVAWARARMTLERLLLELEALQLPYALVTLPPAAPAAAGAAGAASSSSTTQPVVQLRGLPGMALFQQHRRRPGASPRNVGVTQVLFTMGDTPGVWSMQVQGTFFEPFRLPGLRWRPEAAPGAPGTTAGGSTAQTSGPRVYCFDLQQGQDVRGAVVLLQQMLCQQRFLVHLEQQCWGDQQLPVQRCIASSAGGPAPSLPHPAPVPVELAAAGVGVNTTNQQAAGHTDSQVVGTLADTAAATAAAGSGREEPSRKRGAPGDAGDESDPAAKRAKVAAPPANGKPPTAAARSSDDRHSQACGDAVLANGVGHHLQGGAAGATAGAGGHPVNSSSSSCGGLVWHWPGTGLVRLVGVSDTQVLLAAGPPLGVAGSGTPAASAATSTSGSRSASDTLGSTGVMLYSVSWRPQLSPGAAGAALAALKGSSPAARAAAALRMSPAVSCLSHPGLAQEVCEELGAMVAAQEEGTLLDTLALTSWPLAAVAALLPSSPSSPQQPRCTASLVLLGAVQLPRLQLGLGPSAAAPEQQQQLGAGPGAAAGALLAVDLGLASQGRVALSLPGLVGSTTAAGPAGVGGSLPQQQAAAAAKTQGSSSSSLVKQLVERVRAAHPGVPLEAAGGRLAAGGAKGEPGQVWVGAAHLPAVLQCILEAAPQWLDQLSKQQQQQRQQLEQQQQQQQQQPPPHQAGQQVAGQQQGQQVAVKVGAAQQQVPQPQQAPGPQPAGAAGQAAPGAAAHPQQQQQQLQQVQVLG